MYFTKKWTDKDGDTFFQQYGIFPGEKPELEIITRKEGSSGYSFTDEFDRKEEYFRNDSENYRELLEKEGFEMEKPIIIIVPKSDSYRGSLDCEKLLSPEKIEWKTIDNSGFPSVENAYIGGIYVGEMISHYGNSGKGKLAESKFLVEKDNVRYFPNFMRKIFSELDIEEDYQEFIEIRKEISGNISSAKTADFSLWWQDRGKKYGVAVFLPDSEHCPEQEFCWIHEEKIT